MKKLRLVIVGLVLALLLSLIPTVTVMADTSDDVTVTATPVFIAITSAPITWTVNEETGDSLIDPNTEYWSNPLGDTTVPSDPVVDGECRFTVTNTSTVVTDLTVNFIHFTGGDAMQNSETGSNGVGEFGSYAYCTGMTYSTGKVICKNSGSLAMKEDLAATTDIKWGVSCYTQSDAWTSGSNMTSTITITATEA